MSGICGIVNFDGAPVDPEQLKRMAEAVAYRGPDGINYWVNENVGLAHLALHTTPEVVHERQPLVNKRGDLILIADARVDNREELLGSLTSKGYMQEKDPTDIDLILAAYACWGDECPKHIVGDYAIAILDKKRIKLILIRDPMGVKPLFYMVLNKNIYFSSAIGGILAALDHTPDFNEAFIADYLSFELERWRNETIFRSIFRLKPAFLMSFDFDTGKMQKQNYWNVQDRSILHYKNDIDYIEHFQEIFLKAVEARLRSKTDVAINVSGGLDSSFIACQAHYLNSQQSFQNDIHLFALTYQNFPNANEEEYIDEVFSECPNFLKTKVSGNEKWGLKELGKVFFDEPDIIGIAVVFGLLDQEISEGCKVIITGTGGDHVTLPAAYYFPINLLGVKIGKWPTEVKYFIRKQSLASLTKKMLSNVVDLYSQQLLPPSLFQRIMIWKSHRSAPVWLNSNTSQPSFYQYENDVRLKDLLRFPHPASRQIYNYLTSGLISAALNHLEMYTALKGVEYRFPFLDTRLINFMLSLPPRLIFRNGEARTIVRKTEKGALPSGIRTRRTKAYFNDLLDFGIRDKEKKKVELLLNVQNDYVNKFLNSIVFSEYWEDYFSCDKMKCSFEMLAPLLLKAWLMPRLFDSD